MAVSASNSTFNELRAVLGSDSVLPGDTREYLSDEGETHNLRGRADAVALPRDADAVAATVRWCDAHDVPMVPRGGGTGLAGGAVPLDGGVVISLERLAGPVQLDAELWRAHVPAGVRTGDLQRRARESGLFYAPDPGALEQSQLGGNIATNAGGPHAFKYGVTGTWVRGLDLVLASGEPMSIGGAVRKDVAGYDLRSLIVGSEGTLAIVTGAWLRLVPAPEATFPVVAFYPDVQTGCTALATVLGSGLQPAALEYLDEPAVGAAIGAFPAEAPATPAFMLIAEADGSADEARRLRLELLEALQDGALATHAPEERGAIRELWRWRGGVGPAVTTARGTKVSEDIVVPLDHLAEGILATREIGAAPRSAGLQLGPRRRRQPALDVHARSRGRGGGRARRDRRSGALRAGRLPGRIGIGRARARRGQARGARAPVARAGTGPARADQACVRPQGPAQPGKEAGAGWVSSA